MLIVAILLSLTSCGGRVSLQKFTDYSFEYFDTVTTFVGYENEKEEFDLVFNKVKLLMSYYHKLFDIYHTYEGVNNLATINSLQDGKHKEVKVEKELIDFMLFAKEMYMLTNGKTNVAMGSVLSIWHNYRTEGADNPDAAKIPSMDELKAAAEHTNIENVIIDAQKSTVFLSDPKMKLDVGALAKGYAVEKIYQYLKEQNLSGYIINIGGNIKTLGTHPNKKEFAVGIENPDLQDSENPYIETLNIKNTSVVTSGNYQRYYTVNGKNYHHIIDPSTLMPSEYFTLVSVMCEDSGVGDALSTALFCMDIESGKKLLSKVDNAEAIWVTMDGKKHKTDGFK